MKRRIVSRFMIPLPEYSTCNSAGTIMINISTGKFVIKVSEEI